MRKSLLNNLKILILPILSIFLVSFFWDEIKFDYENQKEIVGYYSIFKHSPLNDNFRYIIFITLPILVYLLSYVINKNIKFNSINEYFVLEKNKKKEYFSINFLSLFIFILFFFFISNEFNKNLVDLFHEGQALSGGLNFKINEKLWSNSFIVTGLFVDSLIANIAWKLTDIQSVSSYRFFIEILNFITTCIFFIFFFILSNELSLKKNYKLFIFILLCIFSYSLVKNFTLGYREIPIFLFFIFSFNLLVLNEKKFLDLTILGALPLLSLLWSLDRGIFLSAIYIPFFLILLINKKFLEFFFIVFFIFFSILIFYFIVGEREFIFFISNSYDILSSSDLLNGIIHPAPFSNEDGSSRATKSLIVLVLNGFIIINYLFNDKKILQKNLIIYLSIFFIASLIFYKIGVTRSDGGHIKQGGSLGLLLLYFLAVYNSLIYIEKNNLLKNLRTKIINYVSIFLIFFFFITNLPKNFFENSYTFHNRLINYLNIPDKEFLKKDELELLNKLEIVTKDEKCFQSFTYETAISYYLKKPSCTKFYHIMNLGPKKNQFIFNEELKLSNSQFIITGGTYKNIGNIKGRDQIELSAKNRFPYINEYIKGNYELLEEIHSWNLFVKK